LLLELLLLLTELRVLPMVVEGWSEEEEEKEEEGPSGPRSSNSKV